jgi:ribosomal protein L7/L12
MTLALYIKWLISIGQSTAYLDDVLAEYAKIESFVAYADKTGVYVISSAAIAEVRAGKKIGAIKVVRQELMDKGQPYGLKIAKDIVDAYVLAHPNEYPTY